MCMGDVSGERELTKFVGNTYYVRDPSCVVQRGLAVRVIPSHGREGGE